MSSAQTSLHRHAVLGLTTFCLLLFTFGSWYLPFLGPDEPRYAQVARQMLEDGNWIVPYLGPFPWFEKPVLLYWLIGASYKVFGIHEFAARLPSALAALGSVLLVYAIVRHAAGRRQALLSSLVLATSCFFIGFSHAATFDMLLTFCVTASLSSLLLYELNHNRPSYLYAMYTAAGLSILAKGFAGLILIVLAGFCYLLVSKRWKDAFRMRPISGLLIILAVTAVWFLPVSLIYGIRFWDEFVYQHHFLRYTSSQFHRAQGVFFYIPVFFAGMYPWSLAPLCGINHSSPQKRMLTRLSLCWFGVTFLFFSFSRSKLPGYVLPAAPPFAILSGLAIADFFETSRSPRRIIFLCLLLQMFMVAALSWGARRFTVPLTPVLWMSLAITILTVLSLFLVIRQKLSAAMAAYTAIPLVAFSLFFFLLFPMFHWNDSKELSLEVMPALVEGKKLVLYNIYDFSPLFYTNGRVELTPESYLYNVTDYRQLYRYLSRKKQAWVLAGNEELGWIQEAGFWRVKSVIRGQEISVIELQTIR